MNVLKNQTLKNVKIVYMKILSTEVKKMLNGLDLVPGNFARCSLSLAAYPGSSSSSILLHMCNNLSWQLRNLLTKQAHRSGSFRPSKESSSEATFVKASSAKKNLAIKDRSSFRPIQKFSQIIHCELSFFHLFILENWLKRNTKVEILLNLITRNWLILIIFLAIKPGGNYKSTS